MIKDGLKTLVPPGLSALMQYRLATSLFIIGLVTFAAWGLGIFEKFGFAGLARAADVQVQVKESEDRSRERIAAVQKEVDEKIEKVSKEVKKTSEQVTSLIISDLEQRIWDTRRQQCAVMSAEADRFLNERLQVLRREYVNLTGFAPETPECRKLQ